MKAACYPVLKRRRDEDRIHTHPLGRDETDSSAARRPRPQRSSRNEYQGGQPSHLEPRHVRHRTIPTRFINPPHGSRFWPSGLEHQETRTVLARTANLPFATVMSVTLICRSPRQSLTALWARQLDLGAIRQLENPMMHAGLTPRYQMGLNPSGVAGQTAPAYTKKSFTAFKRSDLFPHRN